MKHRRIASSLFYIVLRSAFHLRIGDRFLDCRWNLLSPILLFLTLPSFGLFSFLIHLANLILFRDHFPSAI